MNKNGKFYVHIYKKKSEQKHFYVYVWSSREGLAGPDSLPLAGRVSMLANEHLTANKPHVAIWSLIQNRLKTVKSPVCIQVFYHATKG